MPTSPLDAQWWEAEAQLLYDELLPVMVTVLALGLDGGTEALPANIQPLVNPNSFNQAAIDFAKKYRYQQIKDITDTTRAQTQEAISQWIQSGQSLDVLESMLAGVFGEARAARIAATEVTRAFTQGNMAAWESTGFVTQGVWMTAQDERVCPICASHEGEHLSVGDIDAAPPNASHPGCRCWIQPEVDEELVKAALDQALGL